MGSRFNSVSHRSTFAYIYFYFQLRAVVPEDLLQIITNDNSKRSAVRSKAERDSRSPFARDLHPFSTTNDSDESPSCDIPATPDSAEEFRQTLHDLREFHASLKVRSFPFLIVLRFTVSVQLRSCIPEDILPVLTKDVNKQNSLRERSLVDAQLPTARFVCRNVDTARSKASDLLEGLPTSRSIGVRRPPERSLTMNLTMSEMKRLIERGFQGPLAADQLPPLANYGVGPLASSKQRQIVATQQLFEFLACLDEKGVQHIFYELRYEDLKVVADVARFVRLLSLTESLRSWILTGLQGSRGRPLA